VAITVKTPSQVAQEYLENLKTRRPEVNIDQTDSDWWVRSRVVGGVVAGVYADLSRVSDDAFPQNARREALEQHLITYFNSGFRQAQLAVGLVGVTGNIGAVISVGTQFVHVPTGNTYAATGTFTLTETAQAIPVISSVAGQGQNLLTDAPLLLSSPPANVAAGALVLTPGITDGRDEETTAEAASRVLARIRQRVRGGTEEDYRQWALEADASVTSANIERFQYGLGTVGIIVSSGTTDIDAAVDTGQSVNVIPSDALLERVRVYVEALNPLTDYIVVQKPATAAIDVTVNVRFESGSGATPIPSLGITQEEAVRREVQRAIYKTPVGGRKLGPSGYVLSSEIEETIDYNLSNGFITQGLKAQIVRDRQVEDLSASGPNRLITLREVAIPGNITINVL
jgi:uncharacterized phage protein gp47/JayE